MLGSIFIGLSGMNAYSQGLQTISNNVSNLNSAGFRADTVRFADLSGDRQDGLSERESGRGGVRLAEPRLDLEAGDLRPSEGDLDLAIRGEGFLVLLDGNRTSYTRTGQFEISEDGTIVRQGGTARLAGLDGANQPIALTVADRRISVAQATTRVTFADNLSASGTEATVSNIAVFDSLGTQQAWTATFRRAVPNEWTVTVTNSDGTDLGGGTLRFDNGAVVPETAQIIIASSPPGAAPLSVMLDFSNGVTGFSTGTTSGLRAANTDGRPAGGLTTVTIDEEGQLLLRYANGDTAQAGGVALAEFEDPQRLQRLGDGLLAAPVDDQPRLRTSGGDGAGTVLARQIENSNVDLAEQFGELILVQRGFQASSQIVSATNEMIQQLFGIKGQS